MGALSKRLGPFPRWVWLVLALLAVYLLYRHAKGGGSSGQVVETTQMAPVGGATSSDSALGAAPSAGSPADTGQSTSDLVGALGGQQASLLSAFEQVNQDVLGLASSQIAAAQTGTSLGSFNTQTQPMAGSQPGGSNAPAIVYVSPTVYTSPTASSSPAVTTKTAAKQTQTPLRYYTYKRDVPLASGQTVHFTAGRGYYAA